MKTGFVILGALISISAAEANVECRFNTTAQGTPYVSISAPGQYHRFGFRNYAERESALDACQSIVRYYRCVPVTRKVSNGDADGWGQHHNTFSDRTFYVHESRDFHSRENILENGDSDEIKSCERHAGQVSIDSLRVELIHQGIGFTLN